MIKVYPAVFHLEDGTYWVEFPDIPGCFSDGATLEDALTNAQEAMAVHLSSLLDHQHPLPVASNLEDIIPEWLNDEAMARNINFSKVLQKGLLQELGIN